MVNYRIAVSGKANSGKNTFSSILSDNMKFNGSQEKIVALADPMKQIMKIMFPESSDECLYGPSELRSEKISDKYLDFSGKTLTYRRALIDLGAFGRKYNDSIWLNYIINDVNRSKDINTYIVSDIRYIEEFKYFKKFGFTMIRILRKNIFNINDSSELEQDFILDNEFDYIIHNDGTIDDLAQNIKELSCKINKSM